MEGGALTGKEVNKWHDMMQGFMDIMPYLLFLALILLIL